MAGFIQLGQMKSASFYRLRGVWVALAECRSNSSWRLRRTASPSTERILYSIIRRITAIKIRASDFLCQKRFCNPDSTTAYVFAIRSLRLLSYWLSGDRSREWVLNSGTRGWFSLIWMETSAGYVRQLFALLCPAPPAAKCPAGDSFFITSYCRRADAVRTRCALADEPAVGVNFCAASVT